MNSPYWNYDFKKDILKENYDEHPIKNILKARQQSLHIETLPALKDFYKVLFNQENQPKDIMNSFWHTYKYMLQLKYPHVFPKNNEIPSFTVLLKEKQKIMNTTVSTSRPPFDGGKGTFVSKGHIEYYQLLFPCFSLDFEKEDFTWIDFLLRNFDKFPDVHEKDDELKKFAKLTHTIGNTIVVPKGFNVGRNAEDYWDFAMIYLYEFLAPISNSTWQSFVEKYALQDYVYETIPTDKNHPIKPFWSQHFDDDIPFTPQSENDIKSFLTIVNANIENRGKKLVERWLKKKRLPNV